MNTTSIFEHYDIDIFNSYAIKILEKMDKDSPTQTEIDVVENLLKELFSILKNQRQKT